MKIISLNKASFAFILGLLLYSAHMQAHRGTARTLPINLQSPVRGIVTDGTIPLPGVTVIVKGTSRSAVTDFDGRYAITAPPGAVLVFSYIGFVSEERTVTGNVLDVALREDSTTLKEVVVNAGYYSIKDKERTGSISRITAKDIEKQPVANVLAAMQGRMAGVDIIQDGGTAGGGFQIKIRGLNSLRRDGNEPLYIIDGVPYSSSSIGSPDTSTATASPTSPLNNINPADIESLEVLKDADATAIYGSRGANGVVLITTKRGKNGRSSVSLSSSTSFGSVTRMLKLMDTPQYLEMRRQAYYNDGISPYPDSAYDINGTWDQKRYTDWQKEFMGGTARISNFTGSVSGGSGFTQYMLSGSYRNETTVLPGDFRYNKASVRFSMNHRSDDSKFTMSFTAGYTNQDNLQAASDLTQTARYLAPNAPALYSADGGLNWENGTFENPMAALESEFRAKTNDMVSNAVLSYKLLPELEIKSSFGYTNLSNDETRTLPSTMYNPAYGIGSESSILSTSNAERTSWVIEPQLRWAHVFGHLAVDALAGATAQQQVDNRLRQMGIGFSSNNLIYNLASASDKYTFVSEEIKYRYQAYFTRLNLNWDQKYIINLTARRDGSSRFGPGNRFAAFGAVGAAWIFTREKFVDENSFLSFGKLRASYGTSGNDQIGDYQFLDTYTASGSIYGGIVGLNPTRLYNPDFGWETNNKFEAALEAGFLQDRIFLSASYYNNRSSSQLVGIPLPGTTGFSSINANLDATVENTGFEFTLRTENFKGKDFEWSTSFNISAAKNKLIEFPNLEGSTYAEKYSIGRSLNIAKLYAFQGVDPQTGLYRFKDYNGDGIISADKDREVIADLTPKFFGGLQNQLRYKNWNLDFLLQFMHQDNYDYISNTAGGQAVNQRNDMVAAWESPGDIAPFQQNTSGANGQAVQSYSIYSQSDATIVDGSYIRLKNIALTYDLPEETFKMLRCRIFLQGQNLLTFTPYRGGDPEFRYQGFLPPLKVYTMGVQLNF